MVKWSHRVKKTFKIRLKLNSNCIKLCMICFGNYSTSSMFCSLLGDDLIVQGCSKFQWNESETLWLYCLAAGLMERPYLCPRTRWQRQSPSDHASRSVTSAVSLGASPMRGLSSLLGGVGRYDGPQTTVIRQPVEWAEASLHQLFISNTHASDWDAAMNCRLL